MKAILEETFHCRAPQLDVIVVFLLVAIRKRMIVFEFDIFRFLREQFVIHEVVVVRLRLLLLLSKG